MEFGEVNTLSVTLSRLPLAGRLVQPSLKRSTHIRDEEHQARELTETVTILEAEGADGAFSWTFADPWLADPHRRSAARPGHDLHQPGQGLNVTWIGAARPLPVAMASHRAVRPAAARNPHDCPTNAGTIRVPVNTLLTSSCR
jgi:hypothetical protein